jgi:Zn-finger nucleic acid-binding protein
MVNPRELSCPSCGAPLPLEAAHSATTCPFCGATAAPAPRVVERVVERIVVAHDPQAAAGGMACPRCARALEEVRSGARSALTCTRCGGVWVDKETADYLMRVSDPDFETAVRRAVGVVISVPLRERLATISCPICAQAARFVDLEGTGQGVDVCDPHGVWFDHNEMSLFVEKHQAARAGEVSDSDLDAAGIRQGFFSRLFRSVFASR